MNACYRVESQSLLLIGKSLVNFAYRKFVKRFACCACLQNWWVDPAHTGPRGLRQKATDLDIIPLCRDCHDKYHEIGRRNFEILWSIDISTIITELQEKAVACGIDLSKDDSPKKRLGVAGGLRRRGVA